jgi:hypothetical protein
MVMIWDIDDVDDTFGGTSQIMAVEVPDNYTAEKLGLLIQRLIAEIEAEIEAEDATKS